MANALMELDARDQEILAGRVEKLNEQEGVRVGDYVLFADVVLRRVSYDWGDSVQTSDGGSYYLGNGYVSMSGSLYTSVPKESLHLTEEVLEGDVWFFHHDWRTAHNGISALVKFRVFTCSLPAPLV
jgi:hypothetical protein